MALRITAHTRQAQQKINRLKARMTPGAIDKVIARAAWKVHRKLVQRTPKRWTGQTRRMWTVTRIRPAHYTVWNRSKVAVWLEYGTKAHGPKTAKMLFIPLNRKAAMSGSAGAVANLKFGKDYIFKRKVRGIRPHLIVTNYIPKVQRIILEEMKTFARYAVNS